MSRPGHPIGSCLRSGAYLCDQSTEGYQNIFKKKVYNNNFQHKQSASPSLPLALTVRLKMRVSIDSYQGRENTSVKGELSRSSDSQEMSESVMRCPSYGKVSDHIRPLSSVTKTQEEELLPHLGGLVHQDQ